MLDHLIVDSPHPGVRRLTLNRPSSLNALSHELVTDLVEALDAIDVDQDVLVAIIRGSGTSFCAGADLREHFLSNDESPDIGFSPLWDRLGSLRVPVIAQVHGYAITGGFLLAYSCDLIVASSDAVFRDSHAKLGLIPTGSESQRLPRRIGQFLARELFFTSRDFPAEEAYRAGLVNRLAAPDLLDDVALELAREITVNSPRSVSTIKRLVNCGLEMSLGAGIRMERAVNGYGRANLDPDPEREERLNAFRTKRPT